MRLIYIDCSEGVSAEALLGAVFNLEAFKNLQITAELKNYFNIDCELKIEKTTRDHFPGAGYYLNCNYTGESVNMADFTEKILDRSKIAKPVQSGFDNFFNRYTAALSRAQNIPADRLSLEQDKLIHITVMGISYFTALAHLNAQKIMATPIPVSDGSIFTQKKDGCFLTEILKGARIGPAKNKATGSTVLGMALVTSSVAEYGPLPEMFLEEVSCGILKKGALEGPGLRIIAGDDGRQAFAIPGTKEKIMVLETNIDDMNPEFFPFLIEQLLNNGALDAFLTPVYMKKGRPANLLTVLCRKEKIEPLLEVVFKETTTLGVRFREEKRRVLLRKIFKVVTPYGEVRIKTGSTEKGGLPVQVAPEFEDCKNIAVKQGVPLKEIYAAAQRAAHENAKKQRPETGPGTSR